MSKLLNYHRYENFLDIDLAEELYKYCIDNKDNFREATVHLDASTKIDKKHRRSLVFRDLGRFKEIIKAWIVEYLPDIYKKLEITAFDIKLFELEIATHGDRAFFTEHIDTLTGRMDKDSARAISLVYYFHLEPKMFEGGDLKLIPINVIPGDDKPVYLSPLHNSLVVFPSFAPHEVLPIHCPEVPFEGWRFTVNIWLYK